MARKRYMLTPVGLKAGDTVIASDTADIRIGNSLPIRYHSGWNARFTTSNCISARAGSWFAPRERPRN